MRYIKILALFSFIFTVSCAQKQKVADSETKAKVVEMQAKADKAYTCQVGYDKRKVSLLKEPKRCEVLYKKLGNEKSIAWAQATPTLCANVFSQVRDNIEAKGFKCMSIHKEKNDAQRKAASAKK